MAASLDVAVTYSSIRDYIDKNDGGRKRHVQHHLVHTDLALGAIRLHLAAPPPPPELSSAGRNIVITGGGTDIGNAIAVAFAKAGAESVAILGRREDKLRSGAANISAAATQGTTQVLYETTDLLNLDQTKAAFLDVANKVRARLMKPLAPFSALFGLTTAWHASSALEKADALANCLTKVGVPIDTAGSPEYKLDATPFNLRLNYTLVAIAAVTTTQHVQDAVACARQLGIKTIQSAAGTVMRTLGSRRGWTLVEGGSRLVHVAWEVYNQGKRAFSHGTCPGVGMGGHVLHGGDGSWPTQPWVNCTESENPDLFWALRGAGGSMGIVTEFRGLTRPQGIRWHETFYSTSLYTKALSESQLQSFISYWFKQAKSNKRDWYVQIDLHGGENSAVSKPSVDSTSYALRDYLFMYLLYDRVDKGGACPADGHLYMENFAKTSPPT
ncbi:hypothetical protein VTI74DRAFT_4543 [Chaetomium olivicolor]